MDLKNDQEYIGVLNMIPQTKASKINDRTIDITLTDIGGTIENKIRLVSKDPECILILQELIENYTIYGCLVNESDTTTTQTYMDSSGYIRNKPEDLIIRNKNINDLIIEKWDQIIELLEREYEISHIVTSVWIDSLILHKVENKKIYFLMPERFCRNGENYLKNKGYDIKLLAAIRDCLNDEKIELEIELYDERR